MRFDANGSPSPNYYPNSFGGPLADPKAGEPSFEVAGMASCQAYTHPNDDFFQAGQTLAQVNIKKEQAVRLVDRMNHLQEPFDRWGIDLLRVCAS
jgi:catalase